MRRLTFLLAASLVIGCSADPPPTDISGGTGQIEVRELHLRSAPRAGGRQNPFDPPAPTVRDLLVQIDDIRESDTAKGLYLRLVPMRGAWGRARDLIEALSSLREAGKPVHCHFENADNVSYAVAALGCDRISMTPAGTLDLVGVAAQVFYARSLLESIGVEAEILAMGRYKSAGDMFTRDDMPDETREALGALLDTLYASLTAAVASRLEGDLDRARSLIDAGPYGAEAAREAGLIDAVAFDDEAREHARVAGDAPRVRKARLLPAAEQIGLPEILAALAGDEGASGVEGEKIALVYVQGTIVDGERPRPGEAVSGPFVTEIRRLADDESVKAVVLRIDSPGGSALASDRMWHAVRRLASRKPVVASLGDVAASGGYYIASAATEIVAHEESIVGSIGVLGGKVDVSALMERLGVHAVTLRRGERAAWSSPLSGFSPSERAGLETMLVNTYDRFIHRVSVGREMERADVLRAAEGRVMPGSMGLSMDLIDAIGGLSSAIARARAAAELGEEIPVEVWPPRQGLLDALARFAGADQDVISPAPFDGMMRSSLMDQAPSLREPTTRALEVGRLLAGDEPTLLLLPVIVQLN